MINNQIKVALVVPPLNNKNVYIPTDPPIGMALISSYLESKGISVILIDSIIMKMSEKDIINLLIDNDVKIIGINCNYCTYHDSTISLSKHIKQSIKNSVVFTGGNHATSISDVLLSDSNGNIDCVIKGEGEITTYEFIQSICDDSDWMLVNGISFIKENKIINTIPRKLIEDLNTMPMPSYHLLPMNLYKRHNVVSARGCPFACDFCASTAIFSRKVRYRSPELVLDEINHLINVYGDKNIWFSDDTFTVNKKHTNGLLDAILKFNQKISWSCLTTVSTINKDILINMKAAGCSYLSYGVESGNLRILKEYVNKPINRDGVIETSNMTHSIGMKHYGFFIVGFPGENWESVNDTKDLIKKSKFEFGGVNVLIPLPGTKIWNILYNQKSLFNLDEIKWNDFFFRGNDDYYSTHAAELASRWCDLSKMEIIDACKQIRDTF